MNQLQTPVSANGQEAGAFDAKKVLTSVGSGMIRGLNKVGRIALNDGRSLLRLDRDWLLEKSRRLTGLNDFGDSDFLEPLEILLRSFEKDADLNLLGRITVHSEMLRMLGNKLTMQHDRTVNPGIAQEKIVKPIFITGLPRSGTTFLHALMSQDPASRAPLVWEVMHPSPPPERATYHSDPRIEKTRRELAWIDVLMPDFYKCHNIDATLPQECISITDHSFLSYVFESMYYVTSYRTWHDQQDKRPAYVCHRKFLQHLQWHCPGGHWVLKAPSHLMALNSLFEIYPDAQIVLTHRDPLKVLPSCASFAQVLRAPFTSAIDLKELGAEVSKRWADSARLLTRMRAAKEREEQFLDVSYHDLLRDPMGVVEGIYRYFQRDLTAEAREAMRQFIAGNPKDKNGAHRYSLQQFGMDPATERRNFQEYTEFFHVPSEV
ncbi:MAG TPA: sulfotransferase [Geomonas sp.]|nr:sulfotransferase [Geomonas sp.]